MDHKEIIHQKITDISQEVLAFIREEEPKFDERWVPAIHIKTTLGLSFVAVPQVNRQYGKKGWLFLIITRLLEDQNLIEYRKSGNRAFYRSVK
jgi:hypothetical protein